MTTKEKIKIGELVYIIKFGNASAEYCISKMRIHTITETEDYINYNGVNYDRIFRDDRELVEWIALNVNKLRLID